MLCVDGTSSAARPGQVQGMQALLPPQSLGSRDIPKHAIFLDHLVGCECYHVMPVELCPPGCDATVQSKELLRPRGHILDLSPFSKTSGSRPGTDGLPTRTITNCVWNPPGDQQPMMIFPQPWVRSCARAEGRALIRRLTNPCIRPGLTAGAEIPSRRRSLLLAVQNHSCA